MESKGCLTWGIIQKRGSIFGMEMGLCGGLRLGVGWKGGSSIIRFCVWVWFGLWVKIIQKGPFGFKLKSTRTNL